MAARPQGLIVVVLAAAGAVCVAAGTGALGYQSAAPATRVVSLVPALTEMLFAMGAGPQVVAVSSYDDYPAETRGLPRVGALLDPDVERIFALRPDLVLTYGSQTTLEAQLARAGIQTFSYRHGGLDTLLRTLDELGAATGRAMDAARVAEGIRRQLDRIRARVRGRPRPRVLLVFGRAPQSLRQMYVSGGVGFLHEMIEVAGGTNVFADLRRESVQPSSEALLARAPDVILELHGTRMIAGDDAARERAAWGALGAIPAVKNARIHFLNGDYLAVPGPRVGLATEAIAQALHPEVFQ